MTRHFSHLQSDMFYTFWIWPLQRDPANARACVRGDMLGSWAPVHIEVVSCMAGHLPTRDPGML